MASSDYCTLCLVHGHTRAGCTSELAAFIDAGGARGQPSLTYEPRTDEQRQADTYRHLVRQAEHAFGSEAAVCRQLGLGGHGALHYRLAHPNIIKQEHILALEALLKRLDGPK